MKRKATRLACLFSGIILASGIALATSDGPQEPVSSEPTADASTTPSDAPQPTSADGVVLPATGTTTSPAPVGLTNTGKTGFWDRDLMTGNWGGFRDTLANDGVKFSPTYTGEVFGNPSGGMKQGVIYDGLFNLPLDLDLGCMSGGAIDDLSIHANAFYIHGTSLSENYVGDFSNTSNIAGYNSIRLQELWLQKWFWEKRISVKIGNIAVDTEYFQSASASLFINGTFGAFTFIGSNVPNAPVYPAASPGVRVQFLPTSDFYVMAGVFGMDNNSDLETNNKHGTRFALNPNSGMLIMTEAGYLVNQSPNDRGLQGTYRLGSFVHTANYDNWGSQAAGAPQSAGANYGIYAVMDQQLYADANERAISLFVRSGGAPSNVNFVDWYVDGGFNFTGFIPGRDSDVAGIAVARSHVSSNYSDSQVSLGAAPYSAETVLEATYKVQLAPWWSIQPDFQYIVTPSGETGSHNATVIGLRTNVAF